MTSNGCRIRVLVADDAPMRAGVRLALEAAGMAICAEADDASAAVKAAVRERPDVCLVETRIPGDGIAATAEIVSKVPTTSVVMLAGQSDDAEFLEACRAGAVGYLPKDVAGEALSRALHGIIHGEAAVPRTLVTRLIEDVRERGRRRRLPVPDHVSIDLTSREWEVLDLMREGLSTKAIASRLYVSRGTVRTHISAILRKLDVPDRDSALRLIGRR